MRATLKRGSLVAEVLAHSSVERTTVRCTNIVFFHRAVFRLDRRLGVFRVIELFRSHLVAGIAQWSLLLLNLSQRHCLLMLTHKAPYVSLNSTVSLRKKRQSFKENHRVRLVFFRHSSVRSCRFWFPPSRSNIHFYQIYTFKAIR